MKRFALGLRVLAGGLVAAAVASSPASAAPASSPAPAATTAPAVSRDADADWLALSDIHLDPYDRSALPAGRWHDSNWALLRSALAAMHAADPDPAVVALPGDFLAHRFARLAAAAGPGGAGQAGAERAGLATAGAIAAALRDTFPRAQFVLALGNNDTPCADYATAFGTPYQAALARIWQPLVDGHGQAPGFAGDFARRGSYVVSLSAHLRVVAFDGVPLSAGYRGNCGHREFAPLEALAWLERALEGAPVGTRTILMMHIPPGNDVFSTELSAAAVAWPFLKAPANAALLEILARAAPGTAFALAGHTHRFDVRLAGGVPISILGSLSPVYGGAPVFYRLRVTPGGELHGLRAYALAAHGGWIAHDFAASWASAPIDAAAIRALHRRLGRDGPMRERWEAQSEAWAAPGAQTLWTGPFWKVAWCAQDAGDRRFTQCAGIAPRNRAAMVAVAVLAALALACAVAGSIVILRSRRARGSVPNPP